MPAWSSRISAALSSGRAGSAALTRSRAPCAPWLRVYASAATVLCLGAWLPAVVATGAHAAPSLRVRAQAHLELHTLGSASGARIAGSLRDDLGAALADRELLLTAQSDERARPRARSLRTDAEGNFEVASPCGAESTCRVSVELDGDAFYEHVQASHLVEPQKAEVRLSFSEPSTLAVDLDRPRTHIMVHASSALGGAGLRATLEDELGRTLAQGTTGSAGEVAFDVDSGALGAAGLGELVVRSAGDASRSAARSGKTVLRSLSTRLALEAQPVRADKRLKLAVRLQTARGPVGQRAVGIFVNDSRQRHLTTLITDAQGAAAREEALEELGLHDGAWQLTARFASDLPGLGSSESPAVRVVVAPPARPSSLWLALPALASMAFALWSARRRQPAAGSAEAGAAREPAVRLGAIVRGRGPLSTCSGRVEDADTSAALPALLELEHESGALASVHSDERGQFVTGELPAGKLRVRVLSQGYASIAFELELPHHGTGDDLRISLRSLRSLALDTYALVVGRALAEPRTQGSTVREALAAAVSGGRASTSVRDLAHATERIAYARPIPFESDLMELQRAAANAVRELGDLSPPPKDPELGR